MHLIHNVIMDGNNVHYIVPSPDNQCAGESCLTLSMLAADNDKSIYIDSNATMIFLEGNHTLDSELFGAHMYMLI